MTQQKELIDISQKNTHVVTEDHLSSHDQAIFSFEFNNSNEWPLHHKTQLHCHDSYKLIWVIAGQGQITIDFTEHPLQAGKLFLIPPRQVYQWHEQALFKGFCCDFSMEIFNSDHHTQVLTSDGILSLESGVNPIQFPRNKATLLNQLAKILCCESQNKDKDWLIIQPLFMTFLYALINPQNKTQQPSHSSPINHLQALIEEHYRQQSQVHFYAQKLKLSIKQLNTLVKEAHGKTVSTLVQERVFLEAKRMLILSKHSVKEIAYQLGFEDPSYFSRFFRRYSGVSPVQYRNNQHKYC